MATVTKGLGKVPHRVKELDAALDDEDFDTDAVGGDGQRQLLAYACATDDAFMNTLLGIRGDADMEAKYFARQVAWDIARGETAPDPARHETVRGLIKSAYAEALAQAEERAGADPAEEQYPALDEPPAPAWEPEL